MQFESEVMAAEYKLKEQFAQNEHIRKMREIEATNAGKVDVAQVNNEQKS